MSRRIVIIETYWYLSYQDGPIENTITKYNSEKEAKNELMRLRKNNKGLYRDVCVMCREHEVEP